MIKLTMPISDEEIRKIFAVMGTASKIYTLDDFPAMDEVEEDGDTFEANALKKAQQIAIATGMTAVADDSGLIQPFRVMLALVGYPIH